MSDDEWVGRLGRAMEARRGLKVIVVADSTDRSSIGALFAAGASVYCVRTAQPEDLAFVVRQAFQRSVDIADEAREWSARPTRASNEPAHELTRRELEILRRSPKAAPMGNWQRSCG